MIRNQDMNSGYDGYRMSKRATEAYSNGEKPLSRWTKKELLDAIGDKRIRKYSLSVLKSYFLWRSSWHHTSRFANSTDFYSIDWDRAEHINFDELDRLEKEAKEKRSGNEDETPRKAIVSYGEWVGTRSHPHLVMRQEYAIIIGRWAYLESGRRKDTTGGHFESCEFLSRAPKGTAETFRNIAKGMKKNTSRREKRCR